MKNRFLVKALKTFHNVGIKNRSITKGKIYLAWNDSKCFINIFIRISQDDYGNKKIRYLKREFKALSFIDIWELKRSGKVFSS